MDDATRTEKVAVAHAHRADAARDYRSDIAVAHIVAAGGVQDCLGERGGCDRRLEAEITGRAVQPVDMLGQLEDAAVDRLQPLEHAVTVDEGVVEHGDLGVVLGRELAVDVDMLADHAGKTPVFRM